MRSDIETKARQEEESGTRLNRHPDVKARVVRRFDLVENAGGDLKRADKAEQRAITDFGADNAVGDASVAGAAFKRLADAAGLNRRTHVHGDGAPWIVEQVETQFGAQGAYLIDFYHLCDYLVAAAPVCDPDQPNTWLDAQKARLKSGQLRDVLSALTPHVETRQRRIRVRPSQRLPALHNESPRPVQLRRGIGDHPHHRFG